MFDTIRKTVGVVGRDRRWRLIALSGMALVQTLLEMLGAALVYVLLGLVADPDGTIGLPLIGDVRGYLGDGGTQATMLLLVALGIFFVARAAFHVLVVHVQHRVAQGLGSDLSIRLTLGYLRMDYEKYVRRNTATLIRNAGAAVERLVTNAFMPLIKVVADGLIAIGLLAVMLVVSPLATALAVLVVGGSQVLLLGQIQPRLKQQGRVVHRLGQRTLEALQSSLNGFRDIRLLGRERAFAETYAVSRRELAKVATQRGTLLAIPPVVMETALVGFILMFFGFALATGMATEQVLSVLGLFAYAGLRLQPTLNRLVSGLNEIRYATASVDEVTTELAFISESRTQLTSDDDGLSWRTLRLSGVSYRYPETVVPALEGVDLEIRRGESLGICGVTGSGKSTLIDLLSGLLVPTSGRVTLDGRDLTEIARPWQRELGVVSQMGFFIDDSIRRNIALGVPDDEIDEEAVARAVELAELDELVRSLPDGLDTHTGERGIRLSGGQRQRIAIARALYRRASLLIFDEGTSSLDNTTEREVMRSLASLQGERTIVLVAHRLSTVERCDRIAYLEHGRLVGLAPYEELIATSSGFRSMASAPQPVE